MPNEHEQPTISGFDNETLNPTFIAQMASRLFNELPEAGSAPGSESDASGAPTFFATSLSDKTAYAGEQDAEQLPFLKALAPPEQDFYFLPVTPVKREEPLGHHANKLTEQQNYSEREKGSNGLDQLLRPSLPAAPLNECYAEKLYREFTAQQGSPVLEVVFQALRGDVGSPAGLDFGRPLGAQPVLPGKAPAPLWPISAESAQLPFTIPDSPTEPYYFLREPQQPIHQPEGFDVATIRKDFPVLHQKIHGKPLAWFDNAATTQKPLSVINAVARFYATDNSNIHRGAHTLAARATDAYEGAREKIRQFIGAGSTSEIIYVRGTTEGINLVAQTWGRKFLQPGDEIILSILEHHANIVPWQMVAQEKGARIKVVPVNDRGEIILEEYTKLLGPRTRLVSLTQASNGLGTILPVKEMIQLAKRYDARVLVDGAQSVAHIPVNVQDLDADFFVFSGHKIFAPTGIGVVYGKKELLEVMPPWQGGGNMIKDVRFEETIYNEAPAKFEAGTPSIGDAIGLGAALDYVRKIGLENIAQYEHELTEYGTEKLIRIPGLRLIGTARNKVGVLSFVLNNLPNEEVGKLLDREGIAVRAGHHCTQPSLRRFGVEGTVRPSLAFYNTKEEIDRLADVINHIQRR